METGAGRPAVGVSVLRFEAMASPRPGSPKCDGAHIWAIYNRGWEDPGHDHAFTTGCIHLGHKGALQRAVKFNWVIWSGECGTVGDHWEL